MTGPVTIARPAIPNWCDDIDLDTVTDLLCGGIFFRSLFRPNCPLDRTQPGALVAALIRGTGPLS